MHATLRALGLSLGLATLAAPGPALADGPAAAAQPAQNPERQELLQQLEKARAQLDEDKTAATTATRAGDKDAARTAQDKVKLDKKALHEIEMKLHALKARKKTAPAGSKAAPAG